MTTPHDSAPPVTTYTMFLSLKEYAEQRNVHPRTVKRWLAADELPGQYKNENGEWMIPANADRTPKSEPDSGTVITLGARPAAREVAETTHAPAAFPNLDRWPTAMMPAEIAAQLIGCTEHAIYTHQEYYGAVKHGRKGGLLVPLATVKRLRGA